MAQVFDNSLLARLSTGANICEDPNVQRVIMTTDEPQQACAVNPTVSYPIDTENLGQGMLETVSLTLTNNTAATVNVILGSQLSQANAYVNYNARPSGVDTPGMVDDYGNFIPKTEGFGRQVIAHSVILSNILVSSSSAPQLGVRPSYGTMDLNSSTCTKTWRLASPVSFNSSDTDRQYNGPIVLSANQFISYPVLAGVTVTLELGIGAKATTENFSA